MKNEWTIYGQSGISDVRAVVRELEYHGSWMEDEFVTVTIKSTVPIKFKHGDYLTYRDGRFSIDYDPSTIQKARKESYDEAFVYENVKLYSDWHAFKDVLFKDYVLNDNGLAYSQQAKFSFFAGSIEDLADRLQANLNRAFGTNVWKIYTPDSVRSGSRHNGSAWSTYYQSSGLETGNKDINVSCDSISCKEALKQSYDLFGLTFIVIGKNVIIGGNKGLNLSKNLEYGKEKGLYEVDKTIDDSQQVVTKMYAFGSSNNLPLNYYANIGKKYYASITNVKGGSSTSAPFVTITTDLSFVKSYFPDVNNWTDSEGNTYRNAGYIVKVSVSDIEVTARVNNPGDDNYVKVYAESLSWSEDPADEPDTAKLNRFIAAARNASTIYFTSGIDKNRWPSDHVENPSSSYPALLSISNLMLPGFPDKSLYDWVVTPVARGGGGGTAINATQGKARITLNGKTYTAYFSKSATEPWIKSVNADDLGTKEGTVYFDGNGDAENVMPSIEGTGADIVSSDSTISDNGFLPEKTDISFKISVAKGILDWGSAWGDRQEDIYIEMKSGFCTGRAFKLLSRPELTGVAWELKLERQYDSSLGRYFPYKEHGNAADYAQIKQGDKFVVTGMQLPKSYVDAAAQKLLGVALERLGEVDSPKITYIPKIDEIFAARDNDDNDTDSLYSKIRAGMKLSFRDTTSGKSTPDVITQYIDNVTIKENGNNGIPTFDVVLRDEKELTFEQRIAGQTSTTGGGRSSYGGITEDDVEGITDGKLDADLFSKLFELRGKIKDGHLDEDGEDTKIGPKDWKQVFSEDDAAWIAWEAEHPDVPYPSLLNIKAKRGLWTEFFMSALGKNENQEGGGTDLTEPLRTINESEMGLPLTDKVGIVWDASLQKFVWGKTGSEDVRLVWPLDKMVDSGLGHPTGNNNALIWDGNNSKFVWGRGGAETIVLENTVGSVTDVYTFNIATSGKTVTLDVSELLSGFVRVDFFEKLFKVHKANSIIATNGDITAGDTEVSIEAMFGFWTEQYISSLGNASGGGSSLSLGRLVQSLNQNDTLPTVVGQTLLWSGSEWYYGTIDNGINRTELKNILSTDYSWWGRNISNGAVTGSLTSVDSITMSGSINMLRNSNGIRFKLGNDDTYTIAMRVFQNSDVLSLGYETTRDAQFETNVYGKVLRFLTYDGTSWPTTIIDSDGNVGIGKSLPYTKLDVNGGVKATKIYLHKPNADNDTNAVYLQYVTENGHTGVKLTGAGFWSDSFVSALGAGSSGSGIELNPLLASLNNSGLTPSTSAQKVLVLNGTSWSFQDYGGGGGSVTRITAGTGLTGGTITSTGTIAVDTTKIIAIRNINGTAGDTSSDPLASETGSFFFYGNNLIDGHYDWVGLQMGSDVDRVQITGADGTLIVRQNDGSGWTSWATVMTNTNYTSLITDASISNAKLTNSSITIAGTAVSLGGSISAATIGNALTSSAPAAYATNAGKATSLKNACTIWGQNFTGNGDNITGDLTINNNYSIRFKDTNGTIQNVLALNNQTDANLAGSAGNLVIGWGVRNTSHTFITGNTVALAYGGTTGLYLNSSGRVGIGTTVPSSDYLLDVRGSIRTTNQLVSTVATGTAPLEVTSTTKVTNLNADMLDGLHAVNIMQDCEHNALGTKSEEGFVKVAVITISRTYANQPLVFRVTQRGRMCGELTLRFANANSTNLIVEQFSYTGDIAGASVVKNGTVWSLYIQKSEGWDSIGISLKDKSSYIANKYSIEWTDVQETPSGTSGTTLWEATCRYYFSHSTYLEFDSTKNGVHLVGGGLYADAYVSALGSNSGGGTTVLNDLLRSLNNSGLTPSTASQKVLVLNGTTWSFQDYGGGGGGSGSGSVSCVIAGTGLTTDTGGSIISTGTISIDSTYQTYISHGQKAYGYFDASGNANSALCLTTKSKNAWGVEYWDASGKPVTISGDMSNVGDISFQASGKNIGGVAYFNTTKTRLGIGAAPGNYTLDVTGNVHASLTSWFPAIELFGELANDGVRYPYIDFHYNQSSGDYTTRIIESANGVLSIMKSSGATGLVVGTSTHNDYIKIGGATIYWDANNQALHIDKGVYSDTFVSALGAGSGGSGGGGGTLYGLSLSGTTLSLVPDGQQTSVNLSNAIGTYISNNLGSMAYADRGDYALADEVVLGVKVNGMTYSPDSDGIADLGTISGSGVESDILVSLNNSTTQLSAGALSYDGSSWSFGSYIPINGSSDITGDLYPAQGLTTLWLGNNGQRWEYVYANNMVGSGDITMGGNISASWTVSGRFVVAGESLKATTIYSSSNGDMTIQGSSSSGDLSLCAGGGNVGVGSSANSNYKLYINGKTKIAETLDINGFSISKNQGSYYIGANTDTWVAGDWYGSFIPDSDQRDKDFVQNTELSLEDVARAPIIEFTWKDKRDNRIHLGTYAQYWEYRLTGAIVTKSNGHLAMDYGATALAAAVMTARTVLTHEEEIAALKTRIGELEDEIEQLKAA